MNSGSFNTLALRKISVDRVDQAHFLDPSPLSDIMVKGGARIREAFLTAAGDLQVN